MAKAPKKSLPAAPSVTLRGPKIIAVFNEPGAPVPIGIDDNGDLWQFLGFSQPSGQHNTITWQGPMGQDFIPLPVNP